MKGDLCPYDHGTDAVVVDDLTITTPTEVSQAPAPEPRFKAIPVQAPNAVAPPPVVQRLPLNIPFPPPPVCCL